MMKKERERNMLDFDTVVNNGVLLMSVDGDGESGIEVYELDSKYYVYSFDVGGSLGGEEVFDNLEEVEEEVLPSITELTYSVGYVNRKYKWVEFK